VSDGPVKVSPVSGWPALIAALAILAGFFLWTGVRGVNFGEHWDERIQILLPLQDALRRGTPLPGH
jgi:hypothetical protein